MKATHSIWGRAKNCIGHADQHEIARMIKGEDGMHRVSYTEKVDELDKETRNQWISSFKNSQIAK